MLSLIIVTVTNLTVGGLLGYSSVNSMVSLKVPSSNGVSCGPKMTAFHIIMLLSVGAPLTPVGGSSCNLKNGPFRLGDTVLADQSFTNRLKSLIRRRLAGVDILNVLC